MRLPPSLFSRLWWLGPVVAIGFLFTVNHARIARLDAVSARLDTDATPTGGHLITPGHDQESFGWLLETRTARATGAWRLRDVDFDNAPTGRVTHRSAPYRWWLSTVATVLGSSTAGAGASLTDLDVAAQWADPLLHLLLVLGVTFYVATSFGGWAAGLTALALALIYPLAGTFAPGSPHSLGLSLGLGCLATLPLLRGLGVNPQSARRSFALAGIAGGLGLWVSVAQSAPWLGGVVIGALLTARVGRRATTAQGTAAAVSAPWRTWAMAGAATVCLAWMVEYVPGAIDWAQVRAIHPLYAVAWWGLGELLHFAVPRLSGRAQPKSSRRALLGLGLAGIAVIALPAVMGWQGNPGFTAADEAASRLARLPGSPAWDNLGTWLKRDGLAASFWATVLPLLVLIPAGRAWWQPSTDPTRARRLALGLGLTFAMVGLACLRLQTWAWVDVALVLLVVALTAGDRVEGALRPRQVAWLVGLLILLLPGVMAAVSAGKAASDPALSPAEAHGLAERNLARWLARRVGPNPNVVLAPPEVTTALAYYGGLHGLGTPFWENSDGFGVAVRLAGTSSQDEALALVENRKLTHIIMPTWDPFLEEYARLGATDLSASLVALLQRWLPPRWLRPVPFAAAPVPGLENDVAVVFEVVDVQDDPTALAHLAEYFIAMGDLRSAVAVAGALRSSFATDVGGMVARAEVARAARNAENFRAAWQELDTALAEGRDRSVTWDMRVSLCLALADAGKFEVLTAQVERTVKEADDARVRELSDVTLFRFLGLMKVMNQTWDDPVLADVARSILSDEQRKAL